MIELMVVIAILGILMALTLVGLGQLRERSAAQNAAHDFSSTLGRARSLAIERGTDVWLIVYPDIDEAGTAGAGNGAYFLFEDPDFRFAGSPIPPVAGELRFATFSPTSESTMTPTGGRGRLLDSTYLDRYTGHEVALESPDSPPELRAPFTSLDPPTSGCSFCSGSPLRGAVVFDGDGRARFYDGAGTELPRVKGSAGHSGYLAFNSPNRDYVFAISAPTGFMATYAH